MTKKQQILKRLKFYLSEYHYSLIRLSMALEGDITLCASIADLIKQYNSSEEDEAQVSILLSQLCKEHFKNVK